MVFRKMFRAGALEEQWAELVVKYAMFVDRHPWPFIILPILATAALSTGVVMHLHVVRGAQYLYSPLDAKWIQEENVFGSNWAADDQHFYPGKDLLRRRGLYLIIEARDHGNVLRQEHAKELLRMLDWVISTRFTTTDGDSYTYKDICLHFQNDCFSNSHTKLIAEIFAKGHESDFNISYPIYRTQYATEPIDLSNTLGNVKVNENGFVVEATAWLLLFQMKKHSPRMNKLSYHFEFAIAGELESGNVTSSLLDVYFFHSDTFDHELGKENKRITPKFSITFTVLIIFSILCTFTVKWVECGKVDEAGNTKTMKVPVIDWVLSKPFLGLVGVASALMAIVSSMGLLLLIGVKFVDMCTVMPFLSLTIGIDDTFLMLAAWHETASLGNDRTARIRACVQHAAVSISITSLTDALAFFISAFAPLPAVMYFCYYASAAIIFIFLYCLSFFLAFLCLQSRLEERGANSVSTRTASDITDYGNSSKWNKLFNMGTVKTEEKDVKPEPIDLNNNEVDIDAQKEVKKDPEDQRMWYQRFFEDKYTPFICSTPVVVFSLFVYICYVTGAVVGMQHLVTGFDLLNIVQSTSPSRAFLNVRTRLFPNDVTQMDVAVLKPPNMANDTQRNNFLSVLQEFEFWLFAYEDYIDSLGFGSAWNDLNQDEELFLSNLAGFLMSNEKFEYDVLRHTNNSLRAFRFSTRVKNVDTDYDRYQCASSMRAISASHSSLNLTTYSPLWNLADQYEIMWPQTLQDIYVSILVMMPVAFLFIPSLLCPIVIALNIASIAFGVLGWMHWLSVNLDCTSMITIAMSVGFSVDFAAHVSYCYMTAPKPKNGEDIAFSNLRFTLGTVGWPVCQGSLAVLLGISSLIFVDSYVVQTCFKTVVLVIVFGTIHALLFLPLVLTFCHRLLLRRSTQIDIDEEKLRVRKVRNGANLPDLVVCDKRKISLSGSEIAVISIRKLSDVDLSPDPPIRPERY